MSSPVRDRRSHVVAEWENSSRDTSPHRKETFHGTRSILQSDFDRSRRCHFLCRNGGTGLLVRGPRSPLLKRKPLEDLSAKGEESLPLLPLSREIPSDCLFPFHPSGAGDLLSPPECDPVAFPGILSPWFIRRMKDMDRGLQKIEETPLTFPPRQDYTTKPFPTTIYSGSHSRRYKICHFFAIHHSLASSGHLFGRESVQRFI